MNTPNGTASPAWRPAGYCAIFGCDIASFGDPARHDRIQRHLRQILYTMLSRSFEASGLSFGRCYHEDRGDGAIVVVPPGTDTALLVSPLFDWLAAEIRRHNDVSSEVARIRLRVCLHAGEVAADGHGIVGGAVNHVHRLLNAPRFKDAIAECGARLGMIVSRQVFESVIRPGEGLIDPADFLPVEVDVKETRTTAWMKVGPGDPALGADSKEIEPRDAGAAVHMPSARVVPMQENGVPVNHLFEITDRLLAIPVMADAAGREQVVGTLRSEVSTRIPRRSQARLDTYSIVRTCLDFPEALQELLIAVRAFAGDSVQMRMLDETIARLVAGPDQP